MRGGEFRNDYSSRGDLDEREIKQGRELRIESRKEKRCPEKIRDAGGRLNEDGIAFSKTRSREKQRCAEAIRSGFCKTENEEDEGGKSEWLVY